MMSYVASLLFLLFVLLYILSFENKNQVHNKWLNALKCKKKKKKKKKNL